MQNYYFDITHPLRPYTHALEANSETVPPANALRDIKPTTKAGYHPGEKNGKWIFIEDHRKEEGYLHGKPHTIADFGPYPTGRSTTPPTPTPEEQLATFTNAIQTYLDDFARTRNYDGIMSAATYAISVVPKFKAEGLYAAEARDTTWAKGYEIMGAVMDGERAMPTWEEVEAELPVLVWPV